MTNAAQALSSGMADRTDSAILRIVAQWPGPALAIDEGGQVLAASSQAGLTSGMAAPFELPDAAAATSATDSSGRTWNVGIAVDGVRMAIADMQSGPDAESRFTAAVSHEIRTPLNGILGMAALLEEGDLSPAQQEYASAIRRSGARLLDLLNNVLDYSRIEAGDVPLEYAPFAVADLVQDVAELLAPRAHEAGLDIAASVDPALPAHLIGDAGRLRQILFNLAGNAIKFTERGGVLISAHPAASGEGVSLVISDTGRGVPEEARARLFDAFSQARADDAARDGGVGLGLAIVAHLARAMKGRIELKSLPGWGAAFCVELPLTAPNAPGPRPAAGNHAGRCIGLDLPPASRLACATALGAEGACVTDLSAVAKRKLDVAVVDAALPPGQLAAIAGGQPTLVVLRPEDRSRIPQFREMGCVGYLIRPLRAASIVERVELALKGERIESDEEAVDNPAEAGAAGRVLIADDNAVNTLLATRALTSAGYSVDAASTGAEALERASEVAYDVIFMDIRMPVMDGLEATRRIRQLAGPAGATPIVAVTADIDPELEGRAQAAGVSQLAAKPIDPPQLRSLADRWKSRHQQAAE